MTPSTTISSMAPASLATTGNSCDIASMITLGSPSRSPSPATRAARQKMSARRRAAMHLLLRAGAAPGDPVGDPQPLGACLQPRRERAAADMLEAPVESVGQLGQRLDQHVQALLLDRARHADDADRACRIAAVAARAARCGAGNRAASRP